GIDGDGSDPHLFRGLDDAAGNFTAVGDQDLLEHDGPWMALDVERPPRSAQPGRPKGIASRARGAVAVRSLAKAHVVAQRAADGADRSTLDPVGAALAADLLDDIAGAGADDGAVGIGGVDVRGAAGEQRRADSADKKRFEHFLSFLSVPVPAGITPPDRKSTRL